jgi:site-specific recombinase XerD
METMLRHVPPPEALVVQRWSGCGLRVSACVPLRVQCLNVAAGVFTMPDGKGGKDRTVPLPDTMLPALRAPLDALQELHQRDLERHDAGGLLVNA